MEIKGVALIPTREYVRRNFEERYSEWLAGLSFDARNIVANAVSSNWYPLQEGMIEPTQKICELFHNGKEEGAWLVGRFSADHALNAKMGLHRVFVKFGSPNAIVSKGSSIFSRYYRPSRLMVVENDRNGCVIHIVEFEEPNRLVEFRIGGWMERAIEVSGKTVTKAKITRSLTRGDPVTEYVLEWR